MVWLRKRYFSTTSMLCDRYSGFPPLHRKPTKCFKGACSYLLWDRSVFKLPTSSVSMISRAMKSHTNQGAEKNGRWNASSALERCVMRRETGLRAPDCDSVQKMAAKIVWDLMPKRDCCERTLIYQPTFSVQNLAISFWSCGQYRMGFKCKTRNDFARNKSRFFITRYFSCLRARLKMFIPEDIK